MSWRWEVVGRGLLPVLQHDVDELWDVVNVMLEDWENDKNIRDAPDTIHAQERLHPHPHQHMHRHQIIAGYYF